MKKVICVGLILAIFLILSPTNTMVLFAFLFFIGLPFALTILNVFTLICPNKLSEKATNCLDGFIITLGTFFTVALFGSIHFVSWDVPLFIGFSDISPLAVERSYTPIAFESIPTVIAICIIALIGYLIPRMFSTKLSPMIGALCYGGMGLGFIFSLFYVIQLCAEINNLFVICFLLFPVNYVLCCVRLIRDTAHLYANEFANNTYKNPILKWCTKAINKTQHFIWFSFLLAFPILLCIIGILLLFGQQPDSAIKAFTNTADWTLSQKIPPPAIDYEGHYLCTVAARGDEKLVKPLRAGKRYGNLIVVNRQLLVANAFEDLIAKRTPRFHKAIRKFYDTHGFPLSRYINTKTRSNITYLIMKPLEWFFLLVLYTFDCKPEDRIAIQYTK